jgi:uncharacterized protein (DUF1810 family)
MDDPFDLQRFLSAQDGTYPAALAEIRAGAKRSHWMWFVFPQIAGLGRSATARHYAISSLEEAEAYLAHPVLGARLRECVDALGRLPDPDAERVFGAIDALKLRSSLTLFAEAGTDPRFADALARWFDGRRDDATHRLLRP